VVDEWLEQRHLARFVVEVIAGLDVRSMTSRYRGTGEAPYHPKLLLGVVVHCYATGVFSSRNLERAIYDSADRSDAPDGLSIPEELARRARRSRRGQSSAMPASRPSMPPKWPRETPRPPRPAGSLAARRPRHRSKGLAPQIRST